MTPKDILNADMETVAAWLRMGVHWWLEELAAALPPQLRRMLAGRARPEARLRPDGGIDLYRGGRPLASLAPGSAVTVTLPESAVLQREIDMPAMPLRDLKQALLLDIDRLTPFRADAVYADARILSRGEQQMRAALAVTPRVRAEQALAAARRLDLAPAALSVALGEGGTAFDFLPAVPAEAGGATVSLRRQIWWGAAAGLLLLNLIVLIAMDMVDLSRLQSVVDSQQPLAAAAQRMKTEWDAADSWQRGLMRRRATQNPLQILDVLSAALPPSAWVRRLDWDGRSLRLVGLADPGVDVAAALRADPHLANIRQGSDIAPAAGSAARPFDITADWKPAP